MPNTPLSLELILPEDEFVAVSTTADACHLELLWEEQEEEANQRKELQTEPSNSDYEYSVVSTDPEDCCGCVRLVTQEPRYNQEYNSFMLNFSGRAAIPNRHNFMLSMCISDDNPHRIFCYDEEEEGDVAMVHYKVGAHGDAHSAVHT